MWANQDGVLLWRPRQGSSVWWAEDSDSGDGADRCTGTYGNRVTNSLRESFRRIGRHRH